MSGIRMDKAMKAFIVKIISRGGLTFSELEDGESQLFWALRDSGMVEKDGFQGPKPIEPTMELYYAAIASRIVTIVYDIKVDNAAPALVDGRVDGVSFWSSVSRSMFEHAMGYGLACGRLRLKHVGRNVYQVIEP